MTSFVNLNGQILPASEARVSLLDHGLLYGDGLFETTRVYGGRFFRLEAHLDRLSRDAERLELRLPWPRELLEEALQRTAVANELADGVLRLTVTRGEGPPLPDPCHCPAPCFFITARPWTPPAPERFERGLTVCYGGRHPRTFIPGLKSLCYLPFQVALQAARRNGCDEALLVSGSQVIEAATSNLFLVRNGEVLTPDLESGCLPGIARGAVLQLCRDGGLPCRETSVDAASLEAAEEIFLTGSVREVSPVTRLSGARVGSGQPGPIARRLHEEYRQLVSNELR